MAGCMNKMLSKQNHTESKNVCECMLGYFFMKYSIDKLQNDIEFDNLLSNDKLRLSGCVSKYLNSSDKHKNIDSTKTFQKIGFIKNYGNYKIEEIEAYVNKQKDTFINQYRFYNNGILDSSKSKFFEFELTGPKDSILTGKLQFYSPNDSLPLDKIHQRNVSFHYIQMKNDSLVFEKIEGITNIIKFPYSNYENFTFVGYVADLRFINMDSTNDSLILSSIRFAIDTEKSTDNMYVELLK